LKASALAGNCQAIFMAAILAFHTGKAVVQIAAIQIPINHLLNVRPPEPVLSLTMFIVDLDKSFKIVLYAVVIIGQLGIPGATDNGRNGHDLSPSRTS
jgi:hypothetical protein